MSKRRADQLNAESIGVGGGRSRTHGTASAKTPAPEASSGWSGVPPELVRRVGQLHDDPKSLAGMERTCKAWRRVIVEGDNGVDMGGTPCLWREMALAKFPRLTPLVEAVRARSQVDPKHSWKALYRVNSEAQRIGQERVHIGIYQAKTSWNDYFLSVEFRREDDVLFIASGKGNETSSLWKQETELDESGRAICTGPLDPNLQSSLGSNPFDVENLLGITARVYITRLSDMSAVELGEVVFNENYDLEDAAGDLVWGGRYHRRSFVPIGRYIFSHSSKPFHAYSDNMRIKLWLQPPNGKVSLEFQKKYEDEWHPVVTDRELAYLEMHCPWPETN